MAELEFEMAKNTKLARLTLSKHPEHVKFTRKIELIQSRAGSTRKN